ncbi:lysine--tRNA ligase [Psychromonas marina]|uniref:Lysine--tRNA ligase n=1 Tax=Psychromonas marina TaxID=88364 RepID=A0ABQ6DX11_9GAMM|nr:lysine--tRNA ligase [Psychromonas marina]GLS89703.1 lysine--tRNA ligase [Psychromonas marina]
MSEQNQTEAPKEDLNDILSARLEKLDAMRAKGQAFPNDFRRKHISDELRAKYAEKSKEELEELAVEVTIAGRMMTRRVMGKASFATIQDMGGQVQVYVARDNLAEGFYNTEFKKWDLGDIVGVQGVLFKTKTDELSVKVSEIRILTKALRPLPDKFHGLSDTESCYRQRYLDLIANEASRKTFILRNKIVSAIRNYLDERNFMEVETPMLQAIPGGASAKPFETFHNALDLPMFLRISPELNLKRLVVGGFERVYEINRSFRNEGVSTRHNPEFTMIEFYQAYADYIDLMNLTEDMLRSITENVLGSSVVNYGEEQFDFGKPFIRMTMKESVVEYNEGIEASELDTMEGLKAVAARFNVNLKDGWGTGKVLTEIFEETAEHKLIQPTFITAYPAEVSPLARRSDEDPDLTDRFEFFVGGRELANGFSELNDAQDQAQRFMDQVAQKDAGDDEAMFYDADYVTALEHGLPPTAGEGIGIDRLVMLFTDSHTIRDVLLFPHMRPQAK